MGGGFEGQKRLLLTNAPCTVSRRGSPARSAAVLGRGWRGKGARGGLGGLGVYRHLTQGEPSTQGLRSVVSVSRVRVWRAKKTTVVARCALHGQPECLGGGGGGRGKGGAGCLQASDPREAFHTRHRVSSFWVQGSGFEGQKNDCC